MDENRVRRGVEDLNDFFIENPTPADVADLPASILEWRASLAPTVKAQEEQNKAFANKC